MLVVVTTEAHATMIDQRLVRRWLLGGLAPFWTLAISFHVLGPSFPPLPFVTFAACAFCLAGGFLLNVFALHRLERLSFRHVACLFLVAGPGLGIAMVATTLLGLGVSGIVILTVYLPLTMLDPNDAILGIIENIVVAISCAAAGFGSGTLSHFVISQAMPTSLATVPRMWRAHAFGAAAAGFVFGLSNSTLGGLLLVPIPYVLMTFSALQGRLEHGALRAASPAMFTLRLAGVTVPVAVLGILIGMASYMPFGSVSAGRPMVTAERDRGKVPILESPISAAHAGLAAPAGLQPAAAHSSWNFVRPDSPLP